MLTESINSVINEIEQMEIDDDGQIVSWKNNLFIIK
jgi:hypothetical protein